MVIIINVLKFSEDPFNKFDCEHAMPTHCDHGRLPGCEDLSCEDYCAKAKGCNPFTLIVPTKKCCECGNCKGKVTHFNCWCMSEWAGHGASKNDTFPKV